jgi:tetratricopeptide (TPR) repeat protein
MPARGFTLTLALALAAPHAAADAIPEKAKQLAEHGRELHDRGDYSDAITAFKEAYVLAPSAGLLFDLAQAYRLAGQCDDAAWMYRRYLESDPTPPHRTLAEGHLATVEKCGHGGLRVVSVPPPNELKLEPPPPDVAIAVAPQPAPSASRDKHLAVGFAITSGALFATAAVFEIQAASNASAVSAAYQSGSSKGKNVGATDTAGQLDADFAIGAAVAGGASLATAAVFYVLGRRAEHHVMATAVPHGAGMAMSWRF